MRYHDPKPAVRSLKGARPSQCQAARQAMLHGWSALIPCNSPWEACMLVRQCCMHRQPGSMSSQLREAPLQRAGRPGSQKGSEAHWAGGDWAPGLCPRHLRAAACLALSAAPVCARSPSPAPAHAPAAKTALHESPHSSFVQQSYWLIESRAGRMQRPF